MTSLVRPLTTAGAQREELITEIDPRHRRPPAAKLELEEARIPRQRLVDVAHLERDMVDADRACHPESVRQPDAVAITPTTAARTPIHPIHVGMTRPQDHERDGEAQRRCAGTDRHEG